MIHVIATIRARHGQHAVLLNSFRKMVPRVLARQGCIQYSLATHLQTSLPGQQKIDRDEFVVVEKWTGLDALEEHLADPAFRTNYANVWHLIEAASMEILSEVE